MVDDAPVSRFWTALSADHRRDLDTYGFDQIKRRQAFKYFTWNWRWSAIRKSEQFQFLLRHSSPATLLHAATAPMRLSDRDWSNVPLPKRDRWLYTFAIRLLWEYARRHDTSGVTALPEPGAGNPLPVEWNGRIISQDLANTALEVSAMLRALEAGAPAHILEIGAGYGRNAYALLSRFPQATYTIVDIEPAVSISRWYLGKLFPGDRFACIAPEELEAVPDGRFGLSLAISSLHEMTPRQVERYLASMDRVTDGVVFLKQWTDWRNPADGVTMRFAEYPVPSSWQRLFSEACPVQTRFTQAAWKTRA